MFRVQLFWVVCLAFIVGCGDTNHPVRRETVTPVNPEPAAPTGAPHAGSGQMAQLPPGHPPMMGGGMAGTGMRPAAAPIQIKAPKDWVPVQPKSSMIQAEFALPKVEGDENDGRLTLMMAGGSVQANVDRWRRQFTQLEDKPTEDIDVAGTKITLVDLSGTFNEQRGMMGPSTQRPNYRMLAAIVQTPEGQLFVKGYGPKNTMAKYAGEFRSFVESLASPPSAKEAPPEEAKPAPAEQTKPAPPEETKPAETKSAPAEEAKPAPPEEAKPAPAKETKPAPPEETKPAEAKPAPAEEAKPAPAEAKPAPAEEAKPAPAEAKPAPAEEAKPAPAEKEK